MSDPQPIAATAGDQDHSDPWVWAGAPTTPPGGDEFTPEELNATDELDSGFDTMADWRNCHSSTRLVEAVNAINPHRSKASDGTIGDRSHASRQSDHNPNERGIVRARNITRNGLDLPALFEKLRKMGAAGDRRLAGGGYLILDRRITAPDFSGWRTYTGSNPHITHGHVSFSRNPAGYDSNDPWVLDGGTRTSRTGRPILGKGAVGAPVKEAQTMLGVPVTGVFDDATEAAVRAFQRTFGLIVDGAVGPRTWAKLDEEMNDMTPEQARQLAEIHRELFTPLNYTHHHNEPEDVLYGHVLSIRNGATRTAVMARAAAVTRRILGGRRGTQAPPT